MIVPVDNGNQGQWAALCAALWPSHNPEEFLEERRSGRLPYEFLMVREGQPVAFLSLSLHSDYVEGTHSSPVGYVEGIYVVPERRGAGVGRELIQFARQWSREQDCRELASDCELENHESRAFHNRIGFREANVTVSFVMDLGSE